MLEFKGYREAVTKCFRRAIKYFAFLSFYCQNTWKIPVKKVVF